MSLRPEVRALIGQLLQPRRPDHDAALQLIEQAEGRLEAGRILRKAKQDLTAHDAFYSAIWDALRAVMEELGLQLAGKKGEDGQHVAVMQFGEAELRDSPDELDAGKSLDAIRVQRNANHYRRASARLGAVPKIAGIVVGAARARIGDS